MFINEHLIRRTTRCRCKGRALGDSAEGDSPRGEYLAHERGTVFPDFFRGVGIRDGETCRVEFRVSEVAGAKINEVITESWPSIRLDTHDRSNWLIPSRAMIRNVECR